MKNATTQSADSYGASIRFMRLATVCLLFTMMWHHPVHAQPTLYGIRTGPNPGDHSLLRIDLTTGSADTLHQIEWLWDLALDVPEGKLYMSANKEILRSDLDGSNLETIIDEETFLDLLRAHDIPLSYCDQSIALDLAARKIYSTGVGWCQSHLFRANLDGSELEWIGNNVMGGSSLTIDSAHEKMYFVGGVAFAGPGVFRANLDGAGIEKLVDLDYAAGEIALDVGEGKMYWSDNRAIFRANLDGSEIEQIANFPNEFGRMTLDLPSRKIYISDRTEGGNLYRCNLDGTVLEAVMAGGFWRMMLAPTGIVVSSESDERVPYSYVLLPAYPNPFNASTTITYVLPRPSAVRVTVIDLLGREVRVLDAGMKPAGTYEVTFDAAGLPSSVYLYRLEAGAFTETRSMVVLK